jgi:hypothetical protein
MLVSLLHLEVRTVDASIQIALGCVVWMLVSGLRENDRSMDACVYIV